MTKPQAGKRIPTLDRYWSKIAKAEASQCWEWVGGKDQDGYGMFWSGEYRQNGKPIYVRAHRWTYETFAGSIPQGQSVLHSCDNPPCCNPAHLSVGTMKENHRQREERGRGVHVKGEEHYSAVLTPELVRLLRSERASEGLSGRELAIRHGLNPSTVNNVIYNKAWRHLL